MKKTYMAPEMEILEAEIEGGILAGSEISQKEEGGYIGGVTPNLGRQQGDEFSFEEDDEDF